MLVSMTLIALVATLPGANDFDSMVNRFLDLDPPPVSSAFETQIWNVVDAHALEHPGAFASVDIECRQELACFVQLEFSGEETAFAFGGEDPFDWKGF